jgi:hypothetical protein
MKPCKLLLASIGATLLMGALVGGASARNFSTSSQTFRAGFAFVIAEGAFGNITCQTTLEGSLHGRTIAKSVGSLIGYITRADLGPCAEGRATILRETLPWHLRYSGFGGALPAIHTIRTSIVGYSYRIQEPFAGCLMRSTVESPVALSFERNTAGGWIEVATVGGSIPTSCGINGSLNSLATRVAVLGTSNTRLTITLI